METSQNALIRALSYIQEQKDQLKIEKEKIDNILLSIGDGVIVVDKDYKIVLFNPKSEEVSGYSINEVIGIKYDDVLRFESEDGSQKDTFIEDAVNSGSNTAMKGSTVLVRKSGEKLPVSDSAATIKNSEGQIVGCIVVFRDVSQERLIDKAKSEIISLASHQLRTPLTALNWHIQILLDDKYENYSEEQKNYLMEMLNITEGMVDMINSLLNVSRIYMGTFEIRPEPVKLKSVIDDVIAELNPTILEKGHNIVYEIEENLPEFSLDPKLIRIVFQNLLSNAVKYSNENGIIKIKVNYKDNNLNIEIEDNGMGIPVEDQDKIFQKLFRAYNATSSGTEGTGLGLYVVKSIIEASGGEITFISKPDKGTTFFIKIPEGKMNPKSGSKSLK